MPAPRAPCIWATRAVLQNHFGGSDPRITPPGPRPSGPLENGIQQAAFREFFHAKLRSSSCSQFHKFYLPDVKKRSRGPYARRPARGPLGRSKTSIQRPSKPRSSDDQQQATVGHERS